MGITHLGLNLLVPYIGEDTPGRSFDGVSDYVDIFSARLAASFAGNEGAVFARALAEDTTSAGAVVYELSDPTSDNRVRATKTTASPQLQQLRTANTVPQLDSDPDGFVSGEWKTLGISFSLAGGVQDYKQTDGANGTQDVISDGFSATITKATIGSLSSGSSLFWYGEISHVLIAFEHLDGTQRDNLWALMDTGSFSASDVTATIGTPNFVLFTLYPNRVDEVWGADLEEYRYFNGVSDYVDLITPATTAMFDGDEGALFVRASNGNLLGPSMLAVDILAANDRVYIQKLNGLDRYKQDRTANAVSTSNTEVAITGNDYKSWGHSWSIANTTHDYRLTDGTAGTSDTITDIFDETIQYLIAGALWSGATGSWHGHISHVVLFYEYLTPTQTGTLQSYMDAGDISASWIAANVSDKFVMWTLYPSETVEEWGEGAPLIYTTSIATSMPTITTSSGTGEWRFIESDGTITDYTSNSPSHVNAAGGSMIVALTNLSAIKDNILTLLIDNEAITSDWSDLNIDNGRLTNLEKISIANNTAMTGDVSNFVIPTDSLTFPNCSLLTGTLTGGFPNIEFFTNNGNIGFDVTGKNVSPGFLYTYLHFNDNSVGDISSFVVPTTLVFLYISDSQISGRPDFNQGVSKNFRTYNCYSIDQWTQSDVDETINEIYACRADFAYATPTLQIGGTNPVPTGTFRYSATPSTPMEKIYALAYDPDDEGFNTWTITFNADTTEAGMVFNGSSDYVDVYTPQLVSLFNGDEGALFVRCNNDNIASTNTEYAVQGLGNGSNYVYIAKTTTPSLLQNLRLASGNADSNNETSVPSGYIATGTNWSLANGTIDYRLTTGALGPQDVVSHSFSAFLSSFTIGSNNTPGFFWTGEISHVVLFYEYLTNTQTSSLWTKMDSGKITAQWIRDNISTKFVLWTLYDGTLGVIEEWGE